MRNSQKLTVRKSRGTWHLEPVTEPKLVREWVKEEGPVASLVEEFRNSPDKQAFIPYERKGVGITGILRKSIKARRYNIRAKKVIYKGQVGVLVEKTKEEEVV